ncbi:MAG: phage baseplate assembly protein W [Arenicella sp.]|jgi:phage baseplate assembly protein W
MNDSHFWGTGWSFPPTFDLGNCQLQLVRDEININQSIDIILSTLRGERTLLPDFGSDVCRYLFKDADETVTGEIAYSVRHNLLDHEPRIDVDDVTVDIEGETELTIIVNIVYTIRSTNSRHNHVFPFSVAEGTNLPSNYRG